MTHTKGPWHVKWDYDNILDVENTHTIRSVDGWNVARIWLSVEEAEANARLIATAPDLLEALETIQSVTKSPGVINETWLEHFVTEAIGKAKGQ